LRYVLIETEKRAAFGGLMMSRNISIPFYNNYPFAWINLNFYDFRKFVVRLLAGDNNLPEFYFTIIHLYEYRPSMFVRLYFIFYFKGDRKKRERERERERGGEGEEYTLSSIQINRGMVENPKTTLPIL
jgi:hypothetical protein